jgi:hypothetical protein
VKSKLGAIGPSMAPTALNGPQRPPTAPVWPPTAPVWPPTAPWRPRWPPNGPLTAPDGPRWPPMAPDGPLTALDGPLRPRDGPRWLLNVPEKSINLIFRAIRNVSICKEWKFNDKNTYLKFAKRKSYLPGSRNLQSESLYRKIFC